MVKHKHSVYFILLVTLIILLGLVVILDGCNIIITDGDEEGEPVAVEDGEVIEFVEGDLTGQATSRTYSRKCIDTDNGIKPDVSGIVNNKKRVYWDRAYNKDPDSIIEFGCNKRKTRVRKKVIKCNNGREYEIKKINNRNRKVFFCSSESKNGNESEDEYFRAEKKFLSTVRDSEDRARLEKALNYKPRKGEKIDENGDIVVTDSSGREIVLLGYNSLKREYQLSQYPTREWKELEQVKKMTTGELKQLLTAPYAQSISQALLLKKPGDSCEVDIECGPDLICADPFEKGDLTCRALGGTSCINHIECYSNDCNKDYSSGVPVGTCTGSAGGDYTCYPDLSTGCDPELYCLPVYLDMSITQGKCVIEGTECLDNSNYCSGSNCYCDFDSQDCIEGVCVGLVGAQCDEEQVCAPNLVCNDLFGLGELTCKGFSGTECSSNGDCYSNWCVEGDCTGDIGDYCVIDSVGCNPEFECVAEFFDNTAGQCAPKGTECLDDTYCGTYETCIDSVCGTLVEFCNDGIQNQDETGIDCGGICTEELNKKCELNAVCNYHSECQSIFCDQIEGKCAVDGLNEINSLFYKKDYKPNGLMYWADTLYMPFLPYLTPIRDQGSRGHCESFARIAAVELVSLTRPDLSEQNNAYLGNLNTPGMPDIKPVLAGTNIGLESEWPYNLKKCKPENSVDPEELSYYSELINTAVPCSDTKHQGIPTENWFEQYDPIIGTTEGRCVTFTSSFLQTIPPSEDKMMYLAYVLNVLKYPIHFGAYAGGGATGLGIADGFIGEEFFGPGGGHAMLLVGFIPNEYIPEYVIEANADNPAFEEDEDYFIIKNSWGTNSGDDGFFYVPSSLLDQQIWGVEPHRYDGDSEYYDNCPPRDFWGVGE
jgi:hypothetical protein